MEYKNIIVMIVKVVEYASMINIKNIVKNVKVLLIVLMTNKKEDVKFVMVLNYANQHGVKQEQLKNMMDIVYFVLLIYFQIKKYQEITKQKKKMLLKELN